MVSVVEVWKPVKGYEGRYEASDQGRIRSVTRRVPCIGGTTRLVSGRIVKLRHGHYLNVVLARSETDKRCFTVHRLVISTFTDGDKTGMQVNHKNGNKHDNRLVNLEWVTPSENLKHAYAIGLSNENGEKNPAAKLTNAQAAEVRSLRGKMSGRQIAAMFGIAPQTVCNIQKGRAYAHA